MCGINGIAGKLTADEVQTVIRKMNTSMKHRGPDDEGSFTADGIGLGHRRLSIIDLSEAGHQPMLNNDKSCVVVFNGEIYNFRSLKNLLPEYRFHTHTDTEVILAAYSKWGISFVEKLDGMFAIALYDTRSGKLYLIRDRLGVKPLYYAIDDAGEIVFASEIRSILDSGRIAAHLNTDELGNYLTFQTSVGTGTLLKRIHALPSGYIAEIVNGKMESRPYWDINQRSHHSSAGTDAEKTTREFFFKAVEKRLISDVPLGAFLSGGIDSTAVVAAMSQFSDKVNTFNINFNEKKFSEAEYAALIAGKYKTNHTQIDLKPEDFLSMFPEALNAMDHPSWDGINTYVVSKVVKAAGLSVALSGVGGDEWFGGYPVFDLLNSNRLGKFKRIPQAIRRPLFGLLAKINKDVAADKKYELLAGEINLENSYYAVRKLFSEAQIASIINYPVAFDHSFYPADSHYSSISVAEWHNYLMPVLLRDTDQMSMAHALEIREPFLDYQLIEYVLSLPDELKKGRTTKSLLVSSMGDLLPPEIVNRPKMGFVLPWEEWLKKDLRSFVEEGLDVLCSHPAFNALTLRMYKQNYYEGKHNIRWNMMLNLTVLGYWIKKNNVR